MKAATCIFLQNDSCAPKRTAGRAAALFRVSSKFYIDNPKGRQYGISMKLEKAADQLEALGNPTRLQLYRTLVRAGEEGLPVGRIQEKLDIAASTLSHHLKRLVDTGLVTQERQATTLICRAYYPGMQALIGYLADECCADGTCLPVAKETVA
jgi:ArsR family transcriptional regulator